MNSLHFSSYVYRMTNNTIWRSCKFISRCI